jgi:hypothetical protein
MRIVEGDIRQPEAILADPALNELIDWDKPVAVMLVALLHFVLDHEDPYGIVRLFRDRMAAGSMLVLTHISSDNADPEAVEQVERIYSGATSKGTFRSAEEIERFFDGFELIAPGVVPAQDWPVPDGQPAIPTPMLGGIGRKSKAAS